MRRTIYECDLCGAKYTTAGDRVDKDVRFAVVAHVIDGEDICYDCFVPIRETMAKLCEKAGRMEGQKP